MVYSPTPNAQHTAAGTYYHRPLNAECFSHTPLRRSTTLGDAEREQGKQGRRQRTTSHFKKAIDTRKEQPCRRRGWDDSLANFTRPL